MQEYLLFPFHIHNYDKHIVLSIPGPGGAGGGGHSPYDWLRPRVQKKKRRKVVFFRHRRRRRFP